MLEDIGELLTKQIVAGDITVEQAQQSFISYYRRRKPETLFEIERRAILNSFDRNDGHKSLIAKELDISRATLYRKLKAYVAY